MQRSVAPGTACSCAPRGATPSRSDSQAGGRGGTSAVRSGVAVKMMLTTSSSERSLRSNISRIRRAVWRSISSFVSCSQVVAQRAAAKFTPTEVSRGPDRRTFGPTSAGTSAVIPGGNSRTTTSSATSSGAARGTGGFVETATSAPVSRRHAPGPETVGRRTGRCVTQSRQHRMPDRLEHPAHLALAPLVDPDLQRRGRRAKTRRRAPARSGRRRAPPLAQEADRRPGHLRPRRGRS